MLKTDKPRLIPSDALDREKYLRCIYSSAHPLVYAWPGYLDRMAKQWSVLVAGDYQTVMPLPWNRKFGMAYVYNPAFTPQLGIFSPDPVGPGTRNTFFRAVKKHFSFCELFLNPGNLNGVLREKTNLTLPLNRSYEDIAAEYRTHLSDNLKKVRNLVYAPAGDYASAVQAYHENFGKRFAHVRDADYAHFADLAGDLHREGALFVREVRDRSTQELLACNIFLNGGQRITNVMPVTLAAGRPRYAGHFMLDRLIHEMAGKAAVLDFEGSSVAGIKTFYERFGAITEPYPFFRFNKLPFPFRYFKPDKKI